VKVPAWFDKYEGKPDHSLLAQWREEHQKLMEQSDYESDEDEQEVENRLDQDRLCTIK